MDIGRNLKIIGLIKFLDVNLALTTIMLGNGGKLANTTITEHQVERRQYLFPYSRVPGYLLVNVAIIAETCQHQGQLSLNGLAKVLKQVIVPATTQRTPWRPLIKNACKTPCYSMA